MSALKSIGMLAGLGLLAWTGCTNALPEEQGLPDGSDDHEEYTPPVICQQDSDCLFGQVCTQGVCADANVDPVEDPACLSDADCGSGLVCAPSIGRCVSAEEVQDPPFESRPDCMDGQVRTCGSKLGRCRYGSQGCVDGVWESTCHGGVGPIAEICNGEDDDCDGVLPDAELDLDGDLVRACAGDCNDADAGIFPGALELCDTQDNDCDPSTLDGEAEPGMGTACDGPDADLCAEGVVVCVDALLICTDEGDENPEVCDELDNDCDPTTPDGADEPGLGAACDGSDDDLCEEGVIACSASALGCTDVGDANFELCDGVDNDCNPASVDGSAEPNFQKPCDGTDGDLCEEGHLVCQGTQLVCDDLTNANLELCDGTDNDCNPTTADGALVDSFGKPCDGPDVDLCEEGIWLCLGTEPLSCSDGSEDNLELCDGQDNDCNPASVDGSAEPNFQKPCDGTDGDLCEEGHLVCQGTQLVCDDLTNANLELCDGTDNDCNPATLDGSGAADYHWACDGADRDLCPDDVRECVQSEMICSSGTDSLELCDFVDNDCNPATPDGAQQDCSQAAAGNPCFDGVCLNGTCQAVNNGICPNCAVDGPTAVAGPDQPTVTPNSVVQLDGTQSSDPQGQPLTYAWSMSERPVGSSATVLNPTSATPTFLADVSGDFIVCLVVTDKQGCASQPDCLWVNVAPRVPLHIELVWFSDKSDIDVHYLANNGSWFESYLFGNGPDCYFAVPNPDWGRNGEGRIDFSSDNDPYLDVDNTIGFGPENINMYELYNTAGSYTVGVHYYDTTGAGAVRARIRIWAYGVLKLEVENTLNCGQLWTVAKVDVTGGGSLVTVTPQGLGLENWIGFSQCLSRGSDPNPDRTNLPVKAQPEPAPAQVP